MVGITNIEWSWDRSARGRELVTGQATWDDGHTIMAGAPVDTYRHIDELRDEVIRALESWYVGVTQ